MSFFSCGDAAEVDYKQVKEWIGMKLKRQCYAVCSFKSVFTTVKRGTLWQVGVRRISKALVYLEIGISI